MTPLNDTSSWSVLKWVSEAHMLRTRGVCIGGGYNHWTELLDWTTRLTQTAKYNSFSAEQKLNILIPSVTLLTLLPT